MLRSRLSSALSFLPGGSGALGALQAAVVEACGTSFGASRSESCWHQRGLSTEAVAAAPGIPAYPHVYAAVVLERLPVVQRPAPEWEAEYNAWAEQRRLQRGFYKQYPASTSKAARQKEDEAETFKPVPIETAADRSGDTSTMKRQLREKLVLLVKQDGGVLGGVNGSGGGGGWAFPHVRHQEGETLRAAAERALRECAGVAEAFFIGNAPMAHYPLDGSSSGGGGGSGGAAAASSGGGSDAPAGTRALSTSSGAGAAAAAASSSSSAAASPSVFFMLAQVVNDPWELALQPAFASDAAWVTVEELPRYLGDDRLAELARRML